MPTFFINGTNLSNSTAVFLDSEQLLCAPDGYYSDGTIIRQQVGCLLLPEIACPSCNTDCSVPADADGGTGAFSLAINTGIATGAILVTFNVGSKPDGIIASFNGSNYNELSSPAFGYLAGTPNLPTYIGYSGAQFDCPGGSVVGGPYTLNKFDWNGTAFVSIPGTETINVLAGQADLSAGDPGDCIMVIPKIAPYPSTVSLSIYGVCTDTIFSVTVACPELLPSFKASNKVSSIEPGYCELSPTIKTYYVAKVNNSDPYPYLAENDWVFQDPYGQTRCLDGFYRTNNLPSPFDTIQVANGIIVNRTVECP